MNKMRLVAEGNGGLSWKKEVTHHQVRFEEVHDPFQGMARFCQLIDGGWEAKLHIHGFEVYGVK